MHQQLNGSSEGKNVRINTGFLKLSGQKRTTKRVNKTYAVFGDIIKRNNLSLRRRTDKERSRKLKEKMAKKFPNLGTDFNIRFHEGNKSPQNFHSKQSNSKTHNNIE